MIKEAKYYNKLDNNKVCCTLCPHGCTISAGHTGICSVRENIDGKLIAKSYGRLVSVNIDPIEKKPLFHFHPTTNIVSIGSYGCNMTCFYCQNYHISQNILVTEYVDYKSIIKHALDNNSPSIAYTYNEPTIYFEYMLDCAKYAKENGLKNVIVTNGMINKEPLLELLPYIDAMNIDLKAFSDNEYKQLTGSLQHVKNTIEIANKHTHVELTFLAVTDFNIDDNFNTMLDYIASVDKNIPLHINKYFPSYKADAAPTDNDVLTKLFDTAKQKLNYCYIGNFNKGEFSNTICPQCSNMIIERNGYDVAIASDLSRCGKCSQDLSIVF